MAVLNIAAGWIAVRNRRPPAEPHPPTAATPIVRVPVRLREWAIQMPDTVPAGTIQFSDCGLGDGYQCGRLSVPTEWSNPGSAPR